MLVTEFCKGGRVNEHRDSLRTIPELLKSTGNIFAQMAGALLSIQQSGCMFLVLDLVAYHAGG